MRQTERILILGTNGTGKTTLSKQFVKNELERKDGRVLIVTPDDAEWLQYPRINIYKKGRIEQFTGAMRHIWRDKNDLPFLKLFKGGLLVFDDCRTYFDAKIDTELRGFFIRSRQRQIDILSIAHGFTNVPPSFFSYTSRIILFKTKDSLEMRKSDIREKYDLLLSEKIHVDQESEKNRHYHKIINF